MRRRVPQRIALDGGLLGHDNGTCTRVDGETAR